MTFSCSSNVLCNFPADGFLFWAYSLPDRFLISSFYFNKFCDCSYFISDAIYIIVWNKTFVLLNIDFSLSKSSANTEICTS